MTDKELLRQQIDDAGYQLEKALEGIDDASLDFKLTEQAMTPREIVAHLAEAYHATAEAAAGRKYEWGTYTQPSAAWPDLWNEVKVLRERAAQAALAQDDPHHAHDYIVAHDFYHVGQLCLVRVTRDPDWNAYSIYKGA